MKKPMILLENTISIPYNIRIWAKSHSVPIKRIRSDNSVSSCAYPPDYEYVIEYSEDLTTEFLDVTYCHSHNLPAVIARTERLVIREIGISDLYQYATILKENPNATSDKSLLSLSPSDFKDRHIAYMKYSYQFLGYGIWGLFANTISSPKMIGIAGLDGTDPELSYAILKDYRKNGYAYEAVSKILEYATTELNINKIRININKDNSESLKLAEKLSEHFPGILVQQLL